MAGPPPSSTVTPLQLDDEDDLPPAFESYTRRRSSFINDLVEGDGEIGFDYADQPPPDDELPDYEPNQLPSYEDDRLQTPSSIWKICQVSKNLQHVTESTSSRSPYRIVFRSSPAMFSKKADLTIHKMIANANPAEDSSPEVANSSVDRGSKLPWMPRAFLSYIVPATRVKDECSMAAPNFNDWKFRIGDKLFSWNLATRPASLVLLDRTAEEVAARFLYSRYGTDAAKGAEVGTLDIYSGYDKEEDGSVEWILASCEIAIGHWKSMGRHYKNAPVPGGRNNSASTMDSLASSLSGASTYSARASTLGAVGARGGGIGARVL